MEERILRTETSEITEAQSMSDWFPDYLYGIIDRPGFVPPLVVERLRRQFGPGNPAEQLEIIRDSLMIFDAGDQSNLANYFCGFPDSALELLQDIDQTIDESIKALDHQFTPYDEPALDLPDDMLPGETVRNYLDRKRFERELIREEKQQQVKAKPSNRAAPIVGPTVTKALDLSGGAVADSRETPWPNFSKVLMPDGHPLAWQNEALCAETDPEAFFPEKGGSTRDAKKICAECEVEEQCLVYALENDERFGIWGGKSERERRKIRKLGQAASEALREIPTIKPKRYKGDDELRLVEPYQQQAARVRHFIRLMDGDSQLEDEYHDHPQYMARVARTLLGEIYPENTSDEINWRRRRLTAYFLDKKWNKYQDESSHSTAYRDLLTADLTDFTTVVTEAKEEYSQTGSNVSFADYLLSKWQPIDIDGATTSVHIKKRRKPVLEEVDTTNDASI